MAGTVETTKTSYAVDAGAATTWDGACYSYRVSDDLTFVDANAGSVTLSSLSDGLSQLRASDGSPTPVVSCDADGNTLIQTGTAARIGSQSFPFSITDGVDEVGLYCASNNAYLKWTDGYLKLSTDEGTNTDTFVDIVGKGTGVGRLLLRDGDDAEYLSLRCVAGIGYIYTVGSSPSTLALQDAAHADVSCFRNATTGETRELQISGFRTSDSLRTLAIGVGVDAADTASFDGLTSYYFQGEVGIDLLGKAVRLGADITTWAARTDATEKTGYVSSPHYTNAEEDFLVALSDCADGTNVLSLGGGNASYNAATEVALYAAANSATVTGTKIVSVDVTGVSVTGTLSATGTVDIADYLYHAGDTNTFVGFSTDKVTLSFGSVLAEFTEAAQNVIEFNSGDTDVDYVFNTAVANAVEIAGDTGILSANVALGLGEVSADPANPADGKSNLWMGDGTGSGADGDVMLETTANGVTTMSKLASHKGNQHFHLECVPYDTTLSIAGDLAMFVVPTALAGQKVVEVMASVFATGSGVDGNTTFMLRKKTGTTEVDVLSSGLSIAPGPANFFATGASINAAYSTLAAGDVLIIDCTAIITNGTAQNGLFVTISVA